MCIQVTPWVISEIPLFTANQANKVIPNCLPSRRLATIPRLTGLSSVAAKSSPKTTPALARAKTGMMTNTTQGCKACSISCSGGSHIFVGSIKGVQGTLAFFVTQHGISSISNLLKMIQEAPAPLEELPSVDEGTGRDGHRQEHPSYGRVQPRLQETEPQPNPQQPVEQWLAHSREI